MQGMQRVLVFLVLLVFAGPVVAEDYPSRPIRAIVPQGPGGLSDIFTRALADELGPALGQTIVVENKVGAAGSLGAKACADSEPDGYTICVLNNESMAVNPLIFKNMTFDPRKDVTPITRLFYLQQVFAVNASLNVKSFEELAALTKSKPKTMTYLAPSLAKVAFMERFNKQYGIDFVRVPFKGGGDAVNSMMGGVTPVAAFGIGNLIQHIRSGKIVGLAVDGALPAGSRYPDLPAIRLHARCLVVRLQSARAGRYAEANHRADQQGRGQDRLEPRVSEAVHDPARADTGFQHAGSIRQVDRGRDRDRT
jgi:tripartite-type tricarboxylate transporter receptor subunit TctC